jgi:hypothetical protein
MDQIGDGYGDGYEEASHALLQLMRATAKYDSCAPITACVMLHFSCEPLTFKIVFSDETRRILGAAWSDQRMSWRSQ